MPNWEQLRDIAQAALDGKTIQESPADEDNWRDCDDGHVWMLDSNNYRYRVKPEPREFWVYDTVDSTGIPSDVWLNGWPTADEIRSNHLIKVREVIE